MIEGNCAEPPTCETTGFDFNDEKCDSGVRFFQTIAATGLDDLCTKMQEVFLNYPINWSINRIRRFSRPVYLEDIKYIIHCCNNYPKAIELLEKINDYYDLENDFKDKRFEMEIHFEIEDFLKEIK